MKKSKKLLAMILTASLIAGLIPGSVFADTTHQVQLAEYTVPESSDTSIASAVPGVVNIVATNTLRTDAAATTKGTIYNVNQGARTIIGGSQAITTGMTGNDLISNLNISDGAATILTRSGITFLDADAVLAGAGDYKNKASALEHGDKLWVLAENQLNFTVYQISAVDPVDVSVTTKGSHYTVGASTISGDQTPITSSVTVQTLRSNLNVLNTAGTAVTSSAVTYANATEFLSGGGQYKALSNTLESGDKFWMLATDIATLKVYTINVTTPLSSDASATSKLTHYTLNDGGMTLVANTTPISTATLVSELIANLNIPTGATWAVTSSATTFNNIAAFIADAGASNKADGANIANGDRLWILAEDQAHMQVYSITAAASPSSQVNVTTKENHYTIDNVGRTISELESGLVTNTLRTDEFIDRLNIPVGAVAKLAMDHFSFTTANFMVLGTFYDPSSLITPGSRLWVISADRQHLDWYDINVTQQVQAISSNGNFRVWITHHAISSQLQILNSETTVGVLKSNLTFSPAGTTAYVTASDKAYTTPSQVVADTAGHKADAEFLATDDKLWVVSQNGVHMRLHPLWLMPISTNNTITSASPGLVTIGANTIASGTAQITENTTVQTLETLFSKHANASVKYLNADTSIPNAGAFDSAIGHQGDDEIGDGAAIFVKAQNGSIKVYTIITASPLSNLAEVTAIAGAVVVNNVGGTIVSGTSGIHNARTVGFLYSQLNFPVGSLFSVTTSATSFTTPAEFNAGVPLYKSPGSKLSVGDKLWVRSQDGNVLKMYQIEVGISPDTIAIVTSQGTHYTVNHEDGTIRSNTTKILEGVTEAISMVLNFDTNTLGRYIIITTSPTPITNVAEFMAYTPGPHTLDQHDVLVNGAKLYIVSKDESAFKAYTIITTSLSSDAEVTTKEDNYLVDNVNNTISADAMTISNVVRVGDLILNLNIPADASYAVTAGSTSFSSPAAFGAGVMLYRPTTATLAVGDKLWVLSEDGTVLKGYQLTVTMSRNTVALIESKLTHYTVNHTDGTIRSNSSLLLDGVTPMNEVLLNFDAGTTSSYLIFTTSPTPITNVAEFNARFSNPDAHSLTEVSTITNGTKVYVMSMDGEQTKAYTIITASTDPLLESAAPGHLLVNGATGTLTSGTFSLTDSVTVSTLLSKLQGVAPGTTTKVVAAASVTASLANAASAPALAAGTTLQTGMKVVSIAQDNAHFKVYTVTLAEVAPEPTTAVPTTTVPTTTVPTTTVPTTTVQATTVPEPTTSAAETIPVTTSAPSRIGSVNGSAAPLGAVTSKESGNGQTSVVSVDIAALASRLLTQGQGANVILPVTSSPRVVFEIGGILQQLLDNRSPVTLASQGAGYTLNPAHMRQILASGTEVVNVNINQVTDENALTDLNRALGNNTLASPLVNFSITKGASAVEFTDKFDTFVERQLERTAALKATTGVVSVGDRVFHVPTRFEDGKAPVISSLTNSSYALVNIVKSFKDIATSKYTSSINNIASRLIIEGTSEDTFSPEEKVTRAEFATMLAKSLGLYRGVQGKVKFNDMTAVEGLNIGISVAADNSFVSGYGKGIFKPDSAITAKEMAQMMYNAARKLNMLEKFKNTGTASITSDWSKDAVAFATSNRLIEDFTNTQPSKAMTRAQAAFAIEQFLIAMALINK